MEHKKRFFATILYANKVKGNKKASQSCVKNAFSKAFDADRKDGLFKFYLNLGGFFEKLVFLRLSVHKVPGQIRENEHNCYDRAHNEYL